MDQFIVEKYDDQQGLFYILGAWVWFFRAHLLKKGVLFACTPLLKIFILKIQGTRHGAIVTLIYC